MSVDVPVPDVPTSWTVRLDSRRRPTLPDEVMRAAGFEIGDELRVRVAEEGLVILETPRHALDRVKAHMHGSAPEGGVVDAFLADRRAEAASES